MTGQQTIFKVGEVYEFFYHGKHRIAKIYQVDVSIRQRGYVPSSGMLRIKANTLGGFRTFIDGGMVNVRKLGKVKRALLWLRGVRL